MIIFTLLAIIAAIAVPRLVDASEDARESALATDLQMLRRQIRMYSAQHSERGPHLDENGALDKTNFPARLLGRTDESGKLNPSGRFGPYMKEWPANPFSPEAVAGKVAFGTGPIAPRDDSAGWYYNTKTCLISPNSREGGKELDSLTDAGPTVITSN